MMVGHWLSYWDIKGLPFVYNVPYRVDLVPGRSLVESSFGSWPNDWMTFKTCHIGTRIGEIGRHYLARI